MTADPARGRVTFPGTPAAPAPPDKPGRPAPPGHGNLRGDRPFPAAARDALGDTQLRRNLGQATRTIRDRRGAAVGELVDWEELRAAAEAVKRATLARLDEHLVRLEEQVSARGGVVHWARDAGEANAIVTDLVRRTGQHEVVKVKSMATQEIGLNEALEAAGLTVHETDLAELIVQLGHDQPSHIVVPAIHRNRAEIREIFRREIPGVDPALGTDPPALAAAARAHLRRTFLRAKVAVSGANFAVADTGTLVVVESEGNGRMCLTLPDTLITVMGIEKVVPSWRDLEVFLQLLPRSATGERMNVAGSWQRTPYEVTGFVWRAGQLRVLPHSSHPNAISQPGILVGDIISRYSRQAFRWAYGNYQALGYLGGTDELGGRWSQATGINIRGQIVGTTSVSNGDRHAYLHTGAGMVDLGTLGGRRARAWPSTTSGRSAETVSRRRASPAPSSGPTDTSTTSALWTAARGAGLSD